MGVNSKIEWTDATWNPITGCFNDCPYCYARRMAERFGGEQKYANVFVEDKPVPKADGTADPYPNSFSPTYHRYRLDVPAKWKRPKKIFVGSMADIFGDWIPDEWIEEIFEACKKAPQHTYMFLTKCPWRYGQLMNGAGLPELPNFWYGSTATHPGMPVFSNERYNTFVSFEPLLEPFDNEHGKSGCVPPVDWVIIGAETGSRKKWTTDDGITTKPTGPKVIPEKEWIDSICKQADKMGQAVFMKDSLVKAKVIKKEELRCEFPGEMETYYLATPWEGVSHGKEETTNATGTD